jgi:hypothetical protein
MILIALDVVLLLGLQRGECIDFIAESGAQSTCTTGPEPEAWFLVALSMLPIFYCVRRLLRSGRP